MKVLELALHNGFDPRTGQAASAPRTGDPASFATFDDLFAAFAAQLRHFLDIKIRGNQLIERMYADAHAAHRSCRSSPTTASRKGRDYNAGGARYNNTFIQFVGIGSITDSLSALKELVFDERRRAAARASSRSLDADFAGHEPLRQRLLNQTHKYGNDDDYADDADGADVPDAASRRSTAGPNTQGRRATASRCCPPPATSTSARCTGATPDGRRRGPAALRGHLARCRAPTATARRPCSSRPPRWTTSRPAARCST